MSLSNPSRTVRLLSVWAVALVATTIFAAQLSTTASTETQTARLVAEMISNFHISKKPLDDRMSEMILKRYLKDMDPQKMYFLQADIDEFAKFKSHLDDLVKAGNVDFAHQAHARYIQRLDERMKVAAAWIETEHDYSANEEMSTDWDNLAYARDTKELDERWRKRVKYELLLQKLDETSKDDPAKRLKKRYETLKRSEHDTEPADVLERYLSSVAHCYDPHSSYLSPQTLEDFNITMRLSLEGIGAALRSEDGYTTVNDIVDGGAAKADGRLMKGDKIIAVGQEEGDFVDIVEMKLNKVVRMIRGPGGTLVRLKVQKPTGEIAIYELTRQKVELKESEVKGDIIDAESRVPGARGKIGVINVPSFYRDFEGAQQGLDSYKSTARDCQKVLERFRREKVEVVVVDLRMNGGGALSEAIEVSGLFIDQGPVVQVKEQDGAVKSHDDEEKGVAWSGPLVVVCNRLSASASEIFAGVIKDYRRGIVIGDTTTHGKGTVQNVMPVSNRLFRASSNSKYGALKLTINQFYRVNGDSTQNRGVESDVVLPSLVDHMDLGEAFLDNALAFDKIDQARHVYYDVASAGVISALRDLSAKRVEAEPKFQQMLKDIERFKERKARKAVSLNEQKLREERAADKAAEDVEKEQEEHDSGAKVDKEVLPKGEYNNELLHISADYLDLLRKAKVVQR